MYHNVVLDGRLMDTSVAKSGKFKAALPTFGARGSREGGSGFHLWNADNGCGGFARSGEKQTAIKTCYGRNSALKSRSPAKEFRT